MACAVAPEPMALGDEVGAVDSPVAGAEDMAATMCLALVLVSLVFGLRLRSLVVTYVHT